ncbi:FBD-associated F-box protein At5g56380 [Raphanus sativus]|uniref:FBD-associated F-box protein At5g56380 n=1 Tax=Raphanus sativus TaxID=3726 RepID=A0A9W3CY79_RAPSA|nr:FBD-associated F-box protein At5g56380 [Raphanus sativus]
MDSISHLPEEIIVKILTFLRTKDVMRTMVLSKRWKSLWILVPRLEFDEVTHFFGSESERATRPDYVKFWRFVDRSLMSRAGQVLQSLYLRLSQYYKYDDVEIWLGTAVKFGLRELKLQYHSSGIGPCVNSLYTCETLVVLRLESGSLDVPDHVCLRSLKTLSLVSMSYSNPNALLRLLPNCPVLEDLFLVQRSFLPNALNYKIIVPSLKRLSLIAPLKLNNVSEVVIDTPLLKSLQIINRSGSLSFSEPMNNSEVLKANIDVILKRPEKLLHSLASIVHIRLCLSDSEVVYPHGCCFHRLKYLEVCTCKSEWFLLFMRLLQDSPVLKVIKINQCHPAINPHHHQSNQPVSVPRCLSSNLEIFEWIKYEGTQHERELSTYILKTAVFLKKASFTARSDGYKEKLQMLQELSFSRRASSTCELVFN